jgi:hypothetical protein
MNAADVAAKEKSFASERCINSLHFGSRDTKTTTFQRSM